MVHGFSEDNTIKCPGDAQISLNNSLKKVPSARGATCILRHTEDGEPDLKLRVDHKGTSAAKTDGYTGAARQIADWPYSGLQYIVHGDIFPSYHYK